MHKTNKNTLEFQKTFTRKKGTNCKANVALLPIPSSTINENKDEEEAADNIKYFQGIFTGISVDICDAGDIIRIFEGGYFGKGSKSRSAPAAVIMQSREQALNEEQASETLVLSLEEACFLAFFQGSLRISDLQQQQMDWKRYFEAAQRVQPNFVVCMSAYLYLRSKGWVVKSGTKFGGHFLLYKKGPRYFHASFLVHVNVQHDETHLLGKDVRGLQRVTESSDKDLLFLEVVLPETDFQPVCLDDFQDISVTETIVRRFNLNVFVQRETPKAKRKR